MERQSEEIYAIVLRHIMRFLNTPTDNAFVQLLAVWKNNPSIFTVHESTIKERIKQKKDEHVILFLIKLSNLANPRRYQEAAELILCALSDGINNPFSWKLLSYILRKGVNINSIPDVDKIFSRATLELSSLDHQAYCHGRALLLDSNLASAWHDLGVTFYHGAEFRSLSEPIRKLFPSHLNQTPALAVYCYSKALSSRSSIYAAWYNIGADFYRGHSLSFACDSFIRKLKKALKQDTPSPIELAQYCLLQAKEHDIGFLMKVPIERKLHEIEEALKLFQSETEVSTLPPIRTILSNFFSNRNVGAISGSELSDSLDSEEIQVSPNDFQDFDL